MPAKEKGWGVVGNLGTFVVRLVLEHYMSKTTLYEQHCKSWCRNKNNFFKVCDLPQRRLRDREKVTFKKRSKDDKSWEKHVKVIKYSNKCSGGLNSGD